MQYVNTDGTIGEGFPKGGYLRLRTEDALVVLIEHRQKDDGSGDFDQSIKMFGPFATADEQRSFMRNVIEGAFPPGPQRDTALAAIDAWRRFDEEADFKEGGIDPGRAEDAASAAPVRTEATASEAPTANKVVPPSMKLFLNGILRRPVW